jgi:hypothetical protein
LERDIPITEGIQNILVTTRNVKKWLDKEKTKFKYEKKYILSATKELLLAQVYRSGLLESIREESAGSLKEKDAKALCIIKRKGLEERTFSFSIKDAIKAKLWGNYGPWTDYPRRMLLMRARGFALRDTFADVIGGLMLLEEAKDIPNEIVEEKPKKAAVKTAVNKKAAVKTSTKTPDIEIRESNWFKEKYLIDSEGNFHLESGAIYSEEERHELVKLNEQDRVKYHENKLKQDIEKNLYRKMIESQELDRNAKKQSMMASV